MLHGLKILAHCLVVLTALAVLSPRSDPAFVFVLVALAAMVAIQGVYWLMTHPVNQAWVEGAEMGKLGGTFFGLFAPTVDGTWTDLRDRWEMSHAIRAGLAVIAFLSTAIALTKDGPR